MTLIETVTISRDTASERLNKLREEYIAARVRGLSDEAEREKVRALASRNFDRDIESFVSGFQR